MARDFKLSRRRLLTAGALAGAAPLASTSAAVIGGELPSDAPAAAAAGNNYTFFNAAEAAFIEAATGRLIPADDLGPGAVEAGVPVFIDRQLAGAFGRGGDWYMQGPWGKGLPTQGYQSRYTPAELYRTAIKAIDQAVGQEGKAGSFAKLAAADQDAFLTRLEKGQVELGSGVDAKAFFEVLLQNTLEGFWSDPIYGGNRDMVGWKLIGFPGARYDHTPYVTRYGEPYPLPPVGLKGRAAWNRS